MQRHARNKYYKRNGGEGIYEVKNWAIENPQSEMQWGKKNEKNKINT